MSQTVLVKQRFQTKDENEEEEKSIDNTDAWSTEVRFFQPDIDTGLSRDHTGVQPRTSISHDNRRHSNPRRMLQPHQTHTQSCN